MKNFLKGVPTIFRDSGGGTEQTTSRTRFPLFFSGIPSLSTHHSSGYLGFHSESRRLGSEYPQKSLNGTLNLHSGLPYVLLVASSDDMFLNFLYDGIVKPWIVVCLKLSLSSSSVWDYFLGERIHPSLFYGVSDKPSRSYPLKILWTLKSPFPFFITITDRDFLWWLVVDINISLLRWRSLCHCSLRTPLQPERGGWEPKERQRMVTGLGW